MNQRVIAALAPSAKPRTATDPGYLAEVRGIFKLFSEHLHDMIPMVNDFTLGLAIEHYHHECRRPRGIYVSIHDAMWQAAYRRIEAI